MLNCNIIEYVNKKIEDKPITDIRDRSGSKSPQRDTRDSGNYKKYTMEELKEKVKKDELKDTLHIKQAMNKREADYLEDRINEAGDEELINEIRPKNTKDLRSSGRSSAKLTPIATRKNTNNEDARSLRSGNLNNDTSKKSFNSSSKANNTLNQSGSKDNLNRSGSKDKEINRNASNSNIGGTSVRNNTSNVNTNKNSSIPSKEVTRTNFNPIHEEDNN